VHVCPFPFATGARTLARTMRRVLERDGRLLVPLGRAAREIGLGQRVLYAARDRGELETFEIARRSYVALPAARAWLERHRRTSGGGES
jgi:hypothetical protein